MREVVAFVIMKDGMILLEKTAYSKKHDAGLIRIPRGTVKFGETLEEALKREMEEELSLSPASYRHACTLLRDYVDHSARIHYLIVDDWRGKMDCKEAESVSWTRLDDISILGDPDSAAIYYIARR